MQLGGEFTDLPPVLDYGAELVRLLATMGVLAVVAVLVAWLDHIVYQLLTPEDERLELDDPATQDGGPY